MEDAIIAQYDNYYSDASPSPLTVGLELNNGNLFFVYIYGSDVVYIIYDSFANKIITNVTIINTDIAKNVDGYNNPFLHLLLNGNILIQYEAHNNGGFYSIIDQNGY